MDYFWTMLSGVPWLGLGPCWIKEAISGFGSARSSSFQSLFAWIQQEHNDGSLCSQWTWFPTWSQRHCTVNPFCWILTLLDFKLQKNVGSGRWCDVQNTPNSGFDSCQQIRSDRAMSNREIHHDATPDWNVRHFTLLWTSRPLLCLVMLLWSKCLSELTS